MRKLSVQELLAELKALKSSNIVREEILSLIDNISQFFKNENIEDYKTNQSMLGI